MDASSLHIGSQFWENIMTTNYKNIVTLWKAGYEQEKWLICGPRDRRMKIM